MIDPDIQKLLGSSDPDPGCDDAGELMDEYCDLMLHGAHLPERFAAFLTHLTNCAACREDTESLLAILRDEKLSGTG